MKVLHQLHWVRALAALSVVAYHTEITLALPKYLGRATHPVFEAGFSGVQLFFVLSGFVIYYVHHHDPERDERALASFALKRIQRLYPTLWVALILVIPLYAFRGALAPGLYDYVASFLILPVDRELLLGAEWTLRHEVLFYLFFAVFIWRREFGARLLLLWAVGGTLLGLFVEQPWPLAFLCNPNHLLFLLGVLVGVAHTRDVRALAPAALVVGAAWFLATCALHLDGRLSPPYETLSFGVGAALFLYGLVGMPSLNVPSRFIALLSGASYALYLLNFPIVAAMCKLAVFSDVTKRVPPSLWFWLTVAVCQVVAVVFHRVIERPLLQAVRPLLLRSTTRLSRGATSGSRP